MLFRQPPGPPPKKPLGRRDVIRGLAATAVAAGSSLLISRHSALAQTAARPRLPSPAPPPIHFDVVRNNDVIGAHKVEFRGNPGEFTVRTMIDIKVRVLGVTVFIFRHDGTERWRNGLLQAFDSKTIDDDSEFFVTGRLEAGAFRIVNRKGTETAPPDIMVGSYWTPEIALQTQLIDPQRGRVKTQQLLSKDKMPLQVGRDSIEATRYRVVGVTDGWVAYDASGRWVAAELKKKGSDILYRLHG
jgi:hypothetical protein